MHRCRVQLAGTIRYTNTVLMLAHRIRRWVNIKPASRVCCVASPLVHAIIFPAHRIFVTDAWITLDDGEPEADAGQKQRDLPGKCNQRV